jgi:arsenate reductase/ArsR family transcriptional regulator
MSDSNLDTALAASRALAHPARLRILAMLHSGDLCVCQITEVLGLAPSTVSAHLRELKLGGLITEHKQGRWVHLALADDAAATAWIGCALDQLRNDPQVAADNDLVAELRDLGVELLCSLGLEEARIRSGKRRQHTESKVTT